MRLRCLDGELHVGGELFDQVEVPVVDVGDDHHVAVRRGFLLAVEEDGEASGEAEPLMRKLFHTILASPEMAGRTEREIYQRITALGSMCMSVCYSSILEGKPDNIDAMKPVLYDIIRRALSPEK